MLNQNTYPDFFDEKVSNETENKIEKKDQLEDLLKLNNQRMNLLENQDKKSLISIVLLVSLWLAFNKFKFLGYSVLSFIFHFVCLFKFIFIYFQTK
jgi:hypothetical protein